MKEISMIKKAQTSNKTTFWILLLISLLILASLAVYNSVITRRSASAQDNIDLPGISLNQVASGLSRPVDITHASDDSGRLFIVEQRGTILILEDALVEIPFLDIQDRVESPATGGGNEEGLLSVAFPPGYADKGYFYVYYTMRNGDNVVSRFSLSDDPNLADADSEEQILVLPHPQYNNHNGGQLAFGPDGYLYIGTGDGGGGGDPLDNAQDPSSLNGKLLRIDVEMVFTTNDPLGWFDPFNERIDCKLQKHDNDGAYAIPADNPFIDDPDFRPEIWALGLRNPWRFSFDRESGDLYIADVGQNRWEEINFQPADSPGGENYGWNIMEGEECYRASSCEMEGLILPVHVYPIFSSPDCSITGGFVYRGEAYPALDGLYIYGDFCSGRIWGLQQDGGTWQTGLLASTDFRISSFGEDERGEIYVADMSGGGVYRIDQP
jgi:glucose/arabinose dehydrogenase